MSQDVVGSGSSQSDVRPLHRDRGQTKSFPVRKPRSGQQRLREAYWSLRVRIWLSLGRPLVRARNLYRIVSLSTWLAWPILRLRRGGEVTVQLRHPDQSIILRCGTSDFDVFRGVFLDGAYDHPPLRPPPVCVVDCGANIGLASLYFLRRYRLDRLIAVEPDPENFAIAERNLRRYLPQVTVVRAAVWPNAAPLSLARTKFRDGRHWAKQVTDEVEGPLIDGVSVTDLFARFHLTRVDILKVDIEGAERQLFSGDCSFLDATECVLIELHDRECENLFETAVARRGFTVTASAMTTVALRHGQAEGSDARPR